MFGIQVRIFHKLDVLALDLLNIPRFPLSHQPLSMGQLFD